MAKTVEEKQLEIKLKGVMDFYVTTYFEYYSQKIKDEVAKQNAWIETDIMESRIDDAIKDLGNEAATKFHDVCMVVLDSIVSGRENKVREFELLFVDLIKRTLIADMTEEKKSPAIIIIADPDVQGKAEEN